MVSVTEKQMETLTYLDNYINIIGGNVNLRKMAKTLNISLENLNFRLSILHRKGLIYYNKRSNPTRGITDLGKKILESGLENDL